MTPAEPARATAPASHPFPLAASPRPWRGTSTPFALHLRAAHAGLPLHTAAPAQGPAADPDAGLRKASQEFEAAFLRQLLGAMRASVHHEALTGSDNPGEAMFTSMLDDRLASVAAARARGGLGEAMYRQLSTHLLRESGAATRSDR